MDYMWHVMVGSGMICSLQQDGIKRACNGRLLCGWCVAARWDYMWHVMVVVLQQGGTICGM